MKVIHSLRSGSKYKKGSSENEHCHVPIQTPCAVSLLTSVLRAAVVALRPHGLIWLDKEAREQSSELGPNTASRRVHYGWQSALG
jgi:hypothetical protein